MEITLIFDGKEKVFKRDVINFKTMAMALDWHERISKEVQAHAELVQKAIDDPEVDLSEDFYNYGEEFDPKEDMTFTTDLICSFFEGLFTYDEFINHCYFKHISEFYQLGADIYDMAFTQKAEAEENVKKKRQLKK